MWNLNTKYVLIVGVLSSLKATSVKKPMPREEMEQKLLKTSNKKKTT